jgi:predicted alpha/beta-hydrolase family hydrolase
MQKHPVTIVVDARSTVSAVWAVPSSFHRAQTDALVLAHGAGNDMHHPFLSFVHETLATAGLLTVKFNFPYTEQGRKAPDKTAILEQTWRAVLHHVHHHDRWQPRRIFAGGKSMGGRMASHLAARGETMAGLVFLGYPLHPANRPAQLRSAHLGQITCPMLFLQGSRDALCRLDLLTQVLPALVAPTHLHVIDQGDHSFQVPKRSGRTTTEVWQEIVQAILRWLKKKAEAPHSPG